MEKHASESGETDFGDKVLDYTQKIHDLVFQVIRRRKGEHSVASLEDMAAMWNALVMQASFIESIMVLVQNTKRLEQEQLYEIYTSMFNFNFTRNMEKIKHGCPQ